MNKSCYLLNRGILYFSITQPRLQVNLGFQSVTRYIAGIAKRNVKETIGVQLLEVADTLRLART